MAKPDEPDQERWLQVALKNESGTGPVSTRRLRKSIIANRLLTPEELHPDPTDRGIENHIPFVNRLVAWWARLREKGWHDEATPEQRAAVKRDLEPILAIYNEL